MKKQLLSLLIIFILGNSLVFAGGSQPGTGTNTANVPAMTGTIGNNLKYDLAAPVNNGQNITIEFWTQNELASVHQKLVDEYTKVHPNVKINLTSASFADLFQKLAIALQTGTGPDIFHMHNGQDGLIGTYLAPYPEDVLPLAALQADFNQVDAHVKNGKLYYIDTGFMTSGIYYNKKMWSEAGLTDTDIPTSWAQLVEVAKKLTKYDASGNITREGFSVNSTANDLLANLSLQDGYFLFDPNGRPLVDNDIWRQNLKFVQDLYTVYKVSSIQFPACQQAMANGQSAMIFNWGWVSSWFANYHDLDWGYFNVPSKDGKIPPVYNHNNGETTISVSSTAKKEAQAVGFDILKYFLCRDDLLLDMNLLVKTVPSKKSLLDNPAIQSNVVLYTQGKIIDRSLWLGPLPAPYFNTIKTYAIDSVMLNNANINDALTETQKILERDFVQAFPDFRSAERQYIHANELR